MFDPNVLMLMVVILVWFSEAHRRIAAFEKWLMITATPVTIAAIDHPNLHRRHITVAGLFDEPRKLSRLGIILTAHAATRHRFSLRLVRRHAFGKNSYRVRIAHAVAAQRAADDIVGEHGF